MTRRICQLADKNNRKNIDLRSYEDIIISTINEVLPNKNPVVLKNSFSTDQLTQGEAVRLGLALSAIPELAKLGKQIKTFRLFDGRLENGNKQQKQKSKDKQSDKEEIKHGRHHRKTILINRGNTNSIFAGE